MTISELIEALEVSKKAVGDIDIYAGCSSEGVMGRVPIRIEDINYYAAINSLVINCDF